MARRSPAPARVEHEFRRHSGGREQWPTPAELKKMLDLGWTHQEIADEAYRRTGKKVTRGAITMAVRRAGLSDREVPRYHETIPWRVEARHAKHNAARNLRLLGRRLRGDELTEPYAQRLDSWLRRLEAENLVVGYWPDTEEGFFYVDPRPGDGENGIPIRVPDRSRKAV